MQMYVGTYIADPSNSVCLFQLNPTTGVLTETSRAPGGPNPSFLALHPNGKVLYAVNELTEFKGNTGGGVSALRVDPLSGSVSLINQQPSHGTDPCHLAIDQTGRWLFVANYSSGSLAVYPIQNDGSLGAASGVIQHTGRGLDDERQAGPHAHAVYPTPDNRFVLACDLGIDKVFIYRLDAQNGKLLAHREVVLLPGAGPRHLDFHPNKKFVYLLNELDATLTVFRFTAQEGLLEELQTLSTLAEEGRGIQTAAEIAVHPSGKFVYASNRNPSNSISIFAVDETTGRLALLGHTPSAGRAPRCFVIDPSGRYLFAANQESGNIVTFEIDPSTGGLTYLGEVQAPMPVCLIFAR